MANEKKQPEDDAPVGAPEWMVTYCDCMTLMLTFFVLLFSFASFDESAFDGLFAYFNRSLATNNSPDKSALLPTKQIIPTAYIEQGSEKVTSAKWSDVREAGARDENNLKEDTESVDFRSQKVFLFSSKKLFFGNGMAISSEGRNSLSKMASFLKEIPCRIVISENGLGSNQDSEQLGLLRSWAVVEYFTTKQELDEGMFSLAANTLQKNYENDQQDYSKTKAERNLEIVLLERSIYN